MRATPSRISPATYPIAASATATAYAFKQEAAEERVEAREEEPGQQRLFSEPAVKQTRVIAFDTLTTSSERAAIRARAAEVPRPLPVENRRIEAKRARKPTSSQADQHELAFGIDEAAVQVAASRMPVDALVATANVRVQAALLDGLFIGFGFAVSAGLFLLAKGSVSLDRHSLPFLAAAIMTVPFFYKLLWVFAGQDSLGTQMAGLELVDFDGKRPSRERRYGRLMGSAVSLFAAGLGMIWALVDEDKLTWHDHMSGTFPTFSSGS